MAATVVDALATIPQTLPYLHRLVKASNSVKVCGSCSNEFDEDKRCPRNLPCHHSFCTLCIGQLIDRGNKKCPVCYSNFEAASARKLDINRDLVFLMKCEKDLEAIVGSRGLVESQEIMMEEIQNERIKINNENISSCHLTQQHIKRAIWSNNELIEKFAKSHQMIKDILNEVKLLDELQAVKVKSIYEANKRLKKHLEDVTGCLDHLSSVKGPLHEEATLQNVDEAVEAEVVRVSFRMWNEQFKIIRSDQEKENQKLRELDKNIKDAEESIIYLRNFLDSFVKRETTNVEHMKSQEDRREQFTPEIKQQANKDIRFLATLGKVSAVQEHKNKSKCRYAKLSLSDDNKVMLHCLRRGNVSKRPYTIDHQMLMKFVNPHIGLTFLELERHESVLGRLFIRHSGGANTQIFTSYCTGEIGQSWLNTSIDKISRNGRCGENLPFLRKGTIISWNRMANATNIEGLVWGAGAGGFSITTRGNPKYYVPSRVGMVEPNLNILTKAIYQNPNVRAILITDCGLVVPD